MEDILIALIVGGIIFGTIGAVLTIVWIFKKRGDFSRPKHQSSSFRQMWTNASRDITRSPIYLGPTPAGCKKPADKNPFTVSTKADCCVVQLLSEPGLTKGVKL